MDCDASLKEGLLRELAHLRQRVSELETERNLAILAHERAACFDHLTGLPTRSVFYNHLSQAIALAERNRQHAAVLFFGLDRFKLINDSLGPEAGDFLLKEVACRLKDALRKSDILARPGRDEFMILLTDVVRVSDVQHVVERIFAAFDTPVTLTGHELIIAGSLGISLYPNDGECPETLIRNSYAALSRARQEGKNCSRFFSPTMNARAFNRLLMENSLRLAFNREEFLIHYQPQVDLVTGQIVGLEALLRWQHPELGIIPPSVFIPVAEEIGLMAPIDEWVLRAACAQNKAYQRAGFPPLRVAVNLSPQQLHKEEFVESVGRALRDTGLSPELLELEVTEGTLVRDVQAAASTLSKLNRMGVGLAIDDFGTGYSSLSYLRFFPIGKLKIDRSFIECISTDPNNAAIARAIIALAHSLKLKVVAEGVETVDQLELLRSLHCDEVQGYLFSQPLPPEITAQVLQSGIGAPC